MIPPNDHLPDFIQASNSITLSLINAIEKAAADAAKTEKSNTFFIPTVNDIESANKRSRMPLRFANSRVLYPTIRPNPKSTSATVDNTATKGINDSGNQGFNDAV